MRQVIFGIMFIMAAYAAVGANDQYAEQQGESTKIASTK